MRWKGLLRRMLLLIPRSLAPASYLIERFKASGPLLQTLFLRVQVKTLREMGTTFQAFLVF